MRAGPAADRAAPAPAARSPRRRCLARTEAGKSHARRVLLRGGVLRGLDGFDGNFDLDEPLEAFAALRGNLDIHCMEANDWHGPGSDSVAPLPVGPAASVSN